jgi:pyruvate formate lyase activating enzyme
MGQYMTAQEVVEAVEKDRAFYENSGGGATISGGEPLGQCLFLEELLQLLGDRGIHRTLDTTGHAPDAVIDKIIPLVDLVLFDVKHLDSDRHKEGTGVGNERILKSLTTIAGRVKTWIRIPLIAGYNDSIGHITGVAELGAELNIDKVSFLPFHEGGISKRAQIGMEESGFLGRPPADDHVETLLSIMEEHHVEASVRS